MRITRLRLRDLKVHRDLDLELAPGLTVVRGPNEAGKSTLQRALELALFRKVTAGGAEIDGLRSWGAPDDGRPWVALEFVQEDPEGTRLGTLEKDFRGARGTARLVLDGEIVNDPARVDEILADLTGIPGEKFFRSTASVRHHEVFDLARDEGALRDRLQASISGADRGTSVGEAPARQGAPGPAGPRRAQPRAAARRRGGRRPVGDEPGPGRGPARPARARPGRPRGSSRTPRRRGAHPRGAALPAGEGAPGGAPRRGARRGAGALRAISPGRRGGRRDRRARGESSVPEPAAGAAPGR